ncbi:SCAN domain-containing protein 3 [Merluccius polli]|uniref:SCAN domain-containing protein 3 n=1 Tax=Merluccius polli TaxID=89951 RepID=A0AA47LZZ4_MERPO|nr:SCAN domain-containing protein 3 [Merluccius polli]
MTLVVKLINSIRAKVLQHRLFKALLDQLSTAYVDLFLHVDVRWLSRGKVLQRFVDLLPEIKTFLETRNEKHEELLDVQPDSKTERTEQRPPGKRHLPHMISTVNAFKAKLKNGRLTHFPNLEKMSPGHW